MEQGCRKDDVIIDRLDQRFTDFLERYERDYQETQKWRNEYRDTLKSHSDFIDEFKPVYKKVMLAVGLICTGSIAFFIKKFWAHIGWN